MVIARVLASVLFLGSTVFTIPLAFDVGGRESGLAFSFSLATFYFLYSLLRLVTPDDSRYRKALIHIVAALQWVVIPTLLIWCLNRYQVELTNEPKLEVSGWVQRTFNRRRAEYTSIQGWLFGRHGVFESTSIGGWDIVLRYSVPIFQLAEGFCTLLVIQAAGQITKWLVNKDGGDNWMIGLLVLSASIISSSLYFLYRITTFPELGNVDAMLIGAALMGVIFLCAWGIGSGRGNPVESSLLFAYVTLAIYQIFTDYQPALPAQGLPSPPQPDFPPLPPMIMASYSTVLHLLSNLPSNIHSAFHFLVAAVMTITPSVLISLTYRVFVFYLSTRIIPAVRESGARALSQEPSLEDSDGVGQTLGFLSWFSPTILIAVYTGLLMQHFASSSFNGNGEWWTSQGGDVGGAIIWRWANLGFTMVLYALELHLGADHDGLTTHWKVD